MSLPDKPHGVDTAQRQADIQFELIRAMANQLPVSVIAEFCVAVYVVWAIWGKNPTQHVALWVAVFAGIQLFQMLAYGQYRKQLQSGVHDTDRWKLTAWGVAIAFGCLWAAVPFVFLAPTASLLTAVPILIALYSLGSGSIPMLMYHQPSMMTFLALVFGSLAAKFFMVGTPDDVALGLSSLAFMMVMMFFGRIQVGVMTEAIRVRYENLDLVAELRHQKEAAEQANRAKSQFFAAASHDLRQPLHALGLFSASLRDMSPEPDKIAVVDQVDASIGALESLFDELLDISKLDAGFVTPKTRHFYIETVLASMRHQFAGQAASKGLALHVVSSSAVVHTDEVLLGRILSNLLANAIRYTDEGKVLLGCRLRGAHLRVEVWDTGRGIPADQHARIFEEFYQLNNPERDRRKGLGLGLATVKRLTALLHHPLRLDSTEGRGTVFRLDVPLGDPQQIATPPAPAASPSDVLTGKRIVVVDDEVAIREGMQRLLVRWGCVPIMASGSAEALQLLDGTPAPDLIICDYRLTGLETGAHVIDAIRARHGAHIPAMLVTGDTSPERLRETLATGHLLQHKPLRPVQLRAACNHLLAGHAER